MNKFVAAAADAGLLAGSALPNAQTSGTDGANEGLVKYQYADALSPAQGIFIITPLPVATGVSEAQAHEPVAALSWRSSVGDAKFLLRWHSNA